MNISEFASKTNAYLTDYIKFSDAKAGATLTLAALVGAVISATSRHFVTLAQLYWGSKEYPTHSVLSHLIVGIGILAAAVASVSVTLTLWYTIRALSPRTATADASLNSFPDIARQNSANTYADVVGELKEGEVAKEYARHNYRLAKIADAKFAAIGIALSCLRIALLSAFFLGLAYACAQS